MEGDLLKAIPEVGIAGFAIYVMWQMQQSHIKREEVKDELFIKQMNERENAFRDLEREARTSLSKQLNESTQALTHSTSIISRALDHLERNGKK